MSLGAAWRVGQMVTVKCRDKGLNGKDATVVNVAGSYLNVTFPHLPGEKKRYPFHQCTPVEATGAAAAAGASAAAAGASAAAAGASAAAAAASAPAAGASAPGAGAGVAAAGAGTDDTGNLAVKKASKDLRAIMKEQAVLQKQVAEAEAAAKKAKPPHCRAKSFFQSFQIRILKCWEN